MMPKLKEFEHNACYVSIIQSFWSIKFHRYNMGQVHELQWNQDINYSATQEKVTTKLKKNTSIWIIRLYYPGRPVKFSSQVQISIVYSCSQYACPTWPQYK